MAMTMSDSEGSLAFSRMVALLHVGFTPQKPRSPSVDAIFLDHPLGRKMKESRLIIYESGTVVGSGIGEDEFRIRSYDEEMFSAFIQSVSRA